MPSLLKKKSTDKNKSKETKKESNSIPNNITKKKAENSECVSSENSALKAPHDFKPRMAEPYSGRISSDEFPTGDFNHLQALPNISDEDRKSLLAMDITTLEVSKRSQANFKDLLWQLIYSRELTNDTDIVRAIFLWLVTKKLHELEFEKSEIGSANETIMKIKNREITYAEVFSIICQHANLQCIVVNGYAKGMEFVPGMKLNQNTQAMHSWNAVRVDKHWHLFDCHWAARRLIGTEPNIETIFSTVDDFYYRSDPNHLKMTHHPHDEQCQLTTDPLSLEEFELICPVKSSFFKYDLKLLTHPHGYIEYDSNQPMCIKVEYPKMRLNKISFTFSLRHEVLGEIYKVEDLSNYAIHYTASLDPPEHAFEFRFPRTGIYNILLYVRDLKSETFSIFAEYRVEARVPKSENGHIPIPYPSTQQNQYGPTQVAAEMGVTIENETKCIYNNVNQCVDIHLRTVEKGSDMPTMVAQLRGMDLNENKLSRFILQRIVTLPASSDEVSEAASATENGELSNNLNSQVHNTLVITPFLPIAGEYSLEIYAEDKDKESNQYHLMWQFLLRTETVHDFGPLPVLPGNVLGPLPDFFNLGLRLYSHPDPFVRIPSVDVADEDKQPCLHAEIAVDIILPPKNLKTGFPTVRVIGQLTTIGEDGEEQSLTEYILQQVIDRKLTFHIRFPKSGLYKMHIYGHALPDMNDTLPVLCTYLFYVMPRLSATALPLRGSVLGPYPKQTNKWKEGALLIEPRKGIIKKADLSENNKLKFNMIVPRAKDVVVVLNGDDVYHLEGTKIEGTDSNQWQGEVVIPNKGDQKVCVAGRWTTQVGNYPTLLEYKLELNN